MTVNPVAFYALAGVVVLAALGVVTARNLVHAAFFLVATLFFVGALYLAIGADFLAGAQILIYAGAIPVLVIFAIMLTRDSMSPTANRLVPWWPLALAAAVAVTGTLVAVIVADRELWPAAPYPRPLLDEGTTKTIGEQLLGRHALPFEVASVLLLAALVGAIVLARRDADETAFEAAEQERRQREERARRRREDRLRARASRVGVGEEVDR